MNPVHLSAEAMFGCCCEEHQNKYLGLSVTPIDIRPPRERVEVPEPSKRKKRGWRTIDSW
jgi:hypothetical protein